MGPGAVRPGDRAAGELVEVRAGAGGGGRGEAGVGPAQAGAPQTARRSPLLY